MSSELGKVITAIREASGLSGRAFALLCLRDDGRPISYNTLSQVEKGRTPDPPIVKALAANRYVREAKYDFEKLQSLIAGVKSFVPKRDFVVAEDAYWYVRELPETEIERLIERLADDDLSNEVRIRLLAKIGGAIAASQPAEASVSS